MIDETEGLERRSYGHEDGAEWSKPKLTIYHGFGTSHQIQEVRTIIASKYIYLKN
jgi:hypothetical protein